MPQDKHITFFFDGTGPRPGGLCSIGVYFPPPVEGDHGEFIGPATNNEAEYHALLWGLADSLRKGATRITAYGDSKLVVEQVNMKWRVREARLLPLHRLARQMLTSFNDWEVSWIPRNENTKADKVGSKALDAHFEFLKRKKELARQREMSEYELMRKQVEETDIRQKRESLAEYDET